MLSKITFVLAELFSGTGTLHTPMVPTFVTTMALVYFVLQLMNAMGTCCWSNQLHPMSRQVPLPLDMTPRPTYL